MKYIKTYENYTEHINEGIFDILKKIFNMMFQGIDKIYTEQTQRVFKDIENKKNPKEIIDILKKFLIISKNTFTKDMESATNLIKLRDAAYSNIISLYSAFTTASKKLSNNKISFENVFGDNPPKGFQKIFVQKDDKKRLAMIKEFSDSLIKNLGAGLKIEDYSSLDNPIGYKEQKPKQAATETPANTETPETTETPAATETPAKQSKPENKQVKISKEQIKNLKDILTQWFDSNIYKKINDNIGDISKTTNTENNDIDKMVNNINATNNKEGVKKMLQAIAKLEDPKKYAEVRDKLAELGIIDIKDIDKF